MAVALAAAFAAVAGIYATWATYQGRKKANATRVAADAVVARAQQWDELKQIVDYQNKQLELIQKRMDLAQDRLDHCERNEQLLRAEFAAFRASHGEPS